MKSYVRIVRVLATTAILVAVIATTIDTASRVAINPFNFFGYFTIQSNLILAAVYALTTDPSFRKPRNERWLSLARACATSYVVVVGLVYAVLLAPLGVVGGVPLPWANTILHIVIPVYAAADWLLVGDRTRLSFRYLWIAAIYPLVWCAVVLARGATDGWVPYPFLDPTNGYGVVARNVVLVAASMVAVAALAFWSSHWRGVLLASRTNPPDSPSAGARAGVRSHDA